MACFFMNKSGPERVLHCMEGCKRSVMVEAGPLDKFKPKEEGDSGSKPGGAGRLP
jgi:hypothetical protein